MQPVPYRPHVEIATRRHSGAVTAGAALGAAALGALTIGGALLRRRSSRAVTARPERVTVAEPEHDTGVQDEPFAVAVSVSMLVVERHISIIRE